MFETVETGARVEKADYERQAKELRVELLNAQFDLQRADFPVVMLLVGDDRQGCVDVLQLSSEWMDGRHIDHNVFEVPTDEERERPAFWRYWRVLPPDGRIGIFHGAWALRALAGKIMEGESDAVFERRLAHINTFENTLADAGALVLKFWIHVPAEELGKRLKRARKKENGGWRVTHGDWELHDRFEELLPLFERYLRKTDSERVPWHLVEGTDERHRDLTVMKALLAALRQRLDAAPAEPAEPVSLPAVAGSLASLDLSRTLDRDEYKDRLEKCQARVRKLTDRAWQEGVSCVLVFEGWDAAGKGGSIRRLTRAIRVANYRTVSVAAPTEEERARHYLWRFWRHIPRAGRLVVFDRSWYGRVLVERVEGFATPGEWRRAYREINDFEDQLAGHGMVVCKFWLHLDPDEQLRRFQAREQTPYKKHKITEEDYRNREKWDDYVTAVDEMVARTSTDIAPWTLVSANDKRFARIQVLETFIKALKARLKQEK